MDFVLCLKLIQIKLTSKDSESSCDTGEPQCVDVAVSLNTDIGMYCSGRF